MNKIDLRSDTVTWPTQEMREAMSQAPVGDDVYGDDPTVIELEEKAAAVLGNKTVTINLSKAVQICTAV